ncbi:MAG TPA: hypothetical protein VKV06_16960 [Acidimicrobiales bacterium]|nr:hypothetical protein [Acidimicrobiales bacterium]
MAQTERRLVTAHLAVFRSPDPPKVVTAAEVLLTVEAAALSGLRWWQRGKRRTAHRAAISEAERIAKAETEDWAAYYRRLRQNDPTTILAALEDAFEDNEHPAAPIDCQDGVATIVVMFDPVSAIPDRTPAVTPSGRPTLHKRTEKDRHHLYGEAMASTVLATVKETYATCQWLQDVKILVIRKDPEPFAPAGYLTAIYAGRFPAERVARIDWPRVDPVEQLVIAPDALLYRSGPQRQIIPLTLESEPELKAVVEQLRRDL